MIGTAVEQDNTEWKATSCSCMNPSSTWQVHPLLLAQYGVYSCTRQYLQEGAKNLNRPKIPFPLTHFCGVLTAHTIERF